MTELAEQIDRLSDRDALRVLALAVDARGEQVDPFAWRETEPRLRQALTQPDLASGVRPDSQATQASLARTALVALAERDPATVERALALPARAGGRIDPLLGLGVGALVLLVFKSDISLEHDPTTGWSFRFRTKALPQSTIGRLMGQLMGVYLDPTQRQ
jgi:hypothetical protein